MRKVTCIYIGGYVLVLLTICGKNDLIFREELLQVLGPVTKKHPFENPFSLNNVAASKSDKGLVFAVQK